MWTIEQISPSLRPYLGQIEAAIAAVEARVAALAPVQRVAFTLRTNRKGALKCYGFGGFCGSASSIRLSFDPKNPKMEAHLGQALQRTIAHEYHHALRWAGPGYGTRLGAALVTEGLAGQFVRQLYDCPPEPWEAHLDAAALAPWRAAAHAAFDARGYGHATWFFGAGAYPLWLGYTLGYDLVGRWLAAHPGQSALGMAHAEYGIFREAVLAG